MAKRRKKYKVGIESETYAISLVEMPAIEEDFIYMAEQEPVKIQMASDEKHMLYGAVLVPDRPIYRISDDGEEYYLQFTAESIEKMSQDFMKEYRQHNMTIDHEEEATEVYVVESWIKEDLFKDKSVALGLNETLPIGTWFCGCKVNNVETWERIKSGELKGFSVESMIQLEDFSKINDNDMDMINFSDMSGEDFLNRIGQMIKDAWNGDKTETADVETELEEQVTETVTETAIEPQEEPIKEPVENDTTVEEIVAQEPNNEVVEEPVKEDNYLQELIKNLQAEIEALKRANAGLTDKVKGLEKEPSAKPVKPGAKVGAGDSYSQWRETMKGLLGR